MPVLSKIPWIDRLFRNVGIGRQSSSLMLMVTPRIIILEEEEERLGIPVHGHVIGTNLNQKRERRSRRYRAAGDIPRRPFS